MGKVDFDWGLQIVGEPGYERDMPLGLRFEKKYDLRERTHNLQEVKVECCMEDFQPQIVMISMMNGQLSPLFTSEQ